MSKVEVDQVTQQSGTTLTVGGGACKTAVVDATTVTLGRCGGTVSLASGATQSGFGRTGTVDWNTTKITADPANAVSGTGYFCDTSGGGFTVTLPTSPSAGDIVAVSDYTRTFATYNLQIDGQSKKIGGVAQDAILTVDGQSATFVFVDDTEGWINTQETQTSQTGEAPLWLCASVSGSCNAIVACGDYKVGIFKNPGCFTVNSVGNPSGGPNIVDYMVVAGGGGGGSSHGGGGGAGGYRESPGTATCYTASPLGAAPAVGVTLTATAYPIAVGGGGPGSTGAKGVTGTPSSGVGSIVSAGGGGGGGNTTPNPIAFPGLPGGSGGGAKGAPSFTIGTGNDPAVSPPQGNPGGLGNCAAGAGGGAGATGGAGTPPGVIGGTGVGTLIINNPSYGTPGPSAPLRYFAGGGGGQGGTVPGGFPGGAGGGGPSANCTAADGTANTGGGGGGNSYGSPTQNGGSGVVMIRYKFQN